MLSERLNLRFASGVTSDVAPLNGLIGAVLDVCPRVHVMRDPTRGGLATVLKEISQASNVGIEIEEESVPVSEAAAAACNMLGLDPLYLANEGKVALFAPEEDAQRIVAAMRQHGYGEAAAVIGRVTEDHPGIVAVRNAFGAKRVVEMLAGDQFPRIC